MTKWSIVRRISVHGGSLSSLVLGHSWRNTLPIAVPGSRCFGSLTKSRRMLFVPIDLSQSWSFFAMHTLPDTGRTADEVLKQILNSSGSSSKFISKDDYTGLVNEYCRVGNLSAAYNLLQSLQDRNIFLPNAQEILLAAAGEKHDIKLACRLFKELLMAGKPLSLDCYLNLSRAFMETDDCTYLLRLVEEVSESSLPISLMVINRILLAFSESRQIDKVLLILNWMKGWRCKPDLITYNTILDVLGRAGRVNEMLQLLSSMKEDGIFPDIITYNTLLNGLRKAGSIGMCLVVYKEMCCSGIEPDLLTYTAIIDSYGRSGNIEESLILFDEMKQRQIRPSLYIYRSLIDSLKKLGNPQKAMQLLDEMNSSSTDLARPEDFKRNLKTYRR